MACETMSLDEAREVIARWLESIDVGDFTDERFEAAVSSDRRLNAAFDTVAASAVEQFSAQVQHGHINVGRGFSVNVNVIKRF
jgi:hypothetical protein